ncbi:hypothetical protein AB0230_01760 [Microbacterium sp. NPDC089190]|uniref:hypothetical protein n=1 Tax=Microbacterium sp. NPDC089190 TaxID=3155063 RepID=UPI00344DEEE6
MTKMVLIGDFQALSDGTAATLVATDGTETQGAVDARVQMVAVDIISSDPTVIASAQAAVDARATELGLVKTSADSEPAETYFRGSDAAKKSWLGFRRKDGGIASRTVWAIVNAIHVYAGYEAPFVYPGGFVLWIDFNESGADMFKKVEA